jgi:hypothetical protein
MTRWTHEQVARLAPDAASLRAARALARAGPWSESGSTDTLAWGRCQGSGSTPYQVTVDLTGPTFRCTCPSRKQPCKHGLALLLRLVLGGGTLSDGPEGPGGPAVSAPPPDLAKARTRRDGPAKDPAAAARRREDRLALMAAGLADLETWLGDLVRGGLAAARQQPYRYWDEAAARLVDAQLPGLAERVRRMGSDVHARTDWADHLLAEAGRWWTAARAWAGRDRLDAAQLGDLRAFLGWPFAKDEIRAADPVTDRWLVLGVHRTDDGHLQQQRTWLWGTTTGETVLILDFAAVGGTLGVAQVVGAVVEAPMGRYPGGGPRRALFAEEPVPVGASSVLPAGGPLDEALARVAAWRAANPWFDRLPVTVAGARLLPPGAAGGPGGGDPGWVVDERGDALPLVAGAPVWPLLALTGGAPAPLFGEIEDGRFRPLTLAGRGLVAV